MIKTIEINTTKKHEMVDITSDVIRMIDEAGINEGLCNIYSRHTTASITINENDDAAVCDDILNFLEQKIKRGVWAHDSSGKCDRVNGNSHIMASMIGPSETIPIKDGRLMLGTWQSIFFCEFDGPRKQREVIVTLISKA